MKRWLGLLCLAAMLVAGGGGGGCSDDDGGSQNQNNENENGNQVSQCGNGEVEGLEECDDGAENSDSRPDACRTDCRQARCGDGVVDSGEPCDDGPQNSDVVPDACRPGCVAPACGDLVTDVEAGERCDDGNTTGGDGCSPQCVPEYCGNGFVEPQEVCDDGNYTAGDGCSAECQSDESCGNGIVDFAVGETCDDGNLASHDGCGSNCAGEIPDWTAWSSGWGARAHHAVASFESQDRLVLFGGESQTGLLEDTWTFDGERWWRLPLDPAPTARRAHALVYDGHRDRVVLFGGETASGAAGDTWEFDGQRWTLLNATPAPPARFGHALTYDPHRQRVVLFGGRDGATGNRLDDTWELDGRTWVPVSTTAAPSARDGYGLAYDPVRRAALLFGGETDAGVTAELWAYDGTDWSVVSAGGTTPPARRDAACYYDVSEGGLVVFGGQGGGGQPLDDVFALVAGTWTTHAPGFTWPSPRYGHAMVYQALSGQALLVGGTDVNLAEADTGDGAAPADTWRYTPGSFSSVSLTLSPPQRKMGHLVWDTHRHRAVLYGGQVEGFLQDTQTWELDFAGDQWVQRFPATNPGHRDRAAMVYDPVRREVVLFGGAEQGGNVDTTATWDGTDWTVEQTTPAPEARHGHAMAWDAQREVVVLFGGQGQTLLDDTWEWDGVAWTAVATAHTPPPRRRHHLAYDAARGRVVLFGGDLGSETLAGDTWEFDGSDWTEIALTQAPPPRKSGVMAHHGARQRVVLFGGDVAGGALADDTWEYDAAAGLWRAVGTAHAPLARRSAAAAYAPALDAVLLHSGYDGQWFAALSNDTWTYGYANALDDEQCDNGVDDDGDALVDCADPDCDGQRCGEAAAVCSAGACACPGGAVEVTCQDRRDEDCDGATDCADADCSADPACEASETRCLDGFDNDGDGYPDCADDDCVSTAACVGGACAGWLPTWCGAVHQGSTDGGATSLADYGCGASNQLGPETVYRLRAPAAGTVSVSLQTSDGRLNLMAVGAAADGACDPAGACLDQSLIWPTESVSWSAQAGASYYVVVETREAGPGFDYTLEVSCTM